MRSVERGTRRGPVDHRGRSAVAWNGGRVAVMNGSCQERDKKLAGNRPVFDGWCSLSGRFVAWAETAPGKSPQAGDGWAAGPSGRVSPCDGSVERDVAAQWRSPPALGRIRAPRRTPAPAGAHPAGADGPSRGGAPPGWYEPDGRTAGRTRHGGPRPVANAGRPPRRPSRPERSSPASVEPAPVALVVRRVRAAGRAASGPRGCRGPPGAPRAGCRGVSPAGSPARPGGGPRSGRRRR